MKVKVTFAGLETVINESDLSINDGGFIDINFNGRMLVRFMKENSILKPIDAMNGWGDNCFQEIKGEEIGLKRID